MQLSTLRRAFRARPGTQESTEFASFLEGLDTSESAWPSLVSLLERDVVPVVHRHHPATEPDEISSTCLTGAFESWVPEWLERTHVVERTRALLARARNDQALDALSTHPRFRDTCAERARSLWDRRQYAGAVGLVEGTRSARSHFIDRTRAQIHEAERKQRRQSRLMAGHCTEVARAPGESTCGFEFDCGDGTRTPWRISALPPAHLASQDLAERLRRMLAAIDALGPAHARVFRLLLEGVSQRRIAELEGRDPAAISRRVRHLREVCRMQLLD